MLKDDRSLLDELLHDVSEKEDEPQPRIAPGKVTRTEKLGPSWRWPRSKRGDALPAPDPAAEARPVANEAPYLPPAAMPPVQRKASGDPVDRAFDRYGMMAPFSLHLIAEDLEREGHGEAQSGRDSVAPAMPPAALQRQADRGIGANDPAVVHRIADAGVTGSGQPMPHSEAIRASFGRFGGVVDEIAAHVGGRAADAAGAIGAEAYATGNSVAFAAAPSLHTAAHEAAHVVQQRAGVSLKGDLGEVGDVYEQHADAVADLVVGGESAEAKLQETATGLHGSSVVQRKQVATSPAPDSATDEIDIQGPDATSIIRAMLSGKLDSHRLIQRIGTENPGLLPALYVRLAVIPGTSAAILMVAVRNEIEQVFWNDDIGLGARARAMFLECLRLHGGAGKLARDLMEGLVVKRDGQYPALRHDSKKEWLDKANKNPDLAEAYGTFKREVHLFVDQLASMRLRQRSLYADVMRSLPRWLMEDWFNAVAFSRGVSTIQGPETTYLRIDVARALHKAMRQGLDMRGGRTNDNKHDGPVAALDWFVPALAEVVSRPDVVRHLLQNHDDDSTSVDDLRHYLRDILWKVHSAGTKDAAREILRRAMADLVNESLQLGPDGKLDPTAANHAGGLMGEYVMAEKEVGREADLAEILLELTSFLSNFAGPLENAADGVASDGAGTRKQDAEQRIERDVKTLLGRIYNARFPAPSRDPNSEKYRSWARQREEWRMNFKQGQIGAAQKVE